MPQNYFLHSLPQKQNIEDFEDVIQDKVLAMYFYRLRYVIVHNFLCELGEKLQISSNGKPRDIDQSIQNLILLKNIL